MKKRYIVLFLLVITLLSCSNNQIDNPVEAVNQEESINQVKTVNENTLGEERVEVLVDPVNDSGKIYIYGEYHGVDVINDKEIEIWKEHYTNGMRHLFVEMSYSKAEFLNVWMTEDHDDRLEGLYLSSYGQERAESFYKAIKISCPETIFHGFDVGHDYLSAGVDYRNYLEDLGLEHTEAYLLNEDVMQQGKEFKRTGDDHYRESNIVENILREFNKLEDQDIMVIIGAAHIGKDPYVKESQEVITMAMRLKDLYKEDRLEIVNLKGEILKTLIHQPISTEEVTVAGKTYQASYFGKKEMLNLRLYDYYEVYRLDNAYEDFKDLEQNGQRISIYNYPMVLEEYQIYMIVMTLKNGTSFTIYTMTDDELEDGLLITKAIRVEE